MEVPITFKELKQMNYAELCAIWEYYFKRPMKAQSPHLYRPLWYKIQCEKGKLKIEQKHITRLNAYAKDPDNCIQKAHKTKYSIKSGTQIVKKYKGREYIAYIEASDRFSYEGKVYKTLSAIALEICGHKVSGYDFFGLTNKSVNQ